MKILTIISFIVFLTPLALHAQVEDLLESFSLTQNENTVVINFAIRGGASCNGVTVERRLSADSFYVDAAAISGVCGGSEFTEHYTLVDEAPLFGETNIYRLVLGTQGFSEEKSLTVIELLNDYKIYPQPAREEIFIAFNNPNEEEVSLSVYALDGKTIINDARSNQAIIYLDGSTLTPGIYLFQLKFGSSKILTGKFIRSS